MFTWRYFLTGIAMYACLCSLLRFRQINNLRRRYKFTDRASLSKMTNEQAQEIVSFIAWSEFPLIYITSMRFALLRVCTPPPSLFECHMA